MTSRTMRKGVRRVARGNSLTPSRLSRACASSWLRPVHEPAGELFSFMRVGTDTHNLALRLLQLISQQRMIKPSLTCSEIVHPRRSTYSHKAAHLQPG